MSKAAKVSFLIAFLILIAVFAVQFMTGMWLNINSIAVGVVFAFIALAIGFDRKMYLEFLTMRTTKHGLNMGSMIIVVVVLLVCVNYLANLHNKSWDLTVEKLNSLSDQSTGLMKGLKEDLEIKVFARGPSAGEDKQKIKQVLALYQDYSSRIKVRFINPYVDNALAMQYLNDLPDRDSGALFVFIEHAGKKVRAEQPFDEASITSAMTKATRQGESKIYFIKGHGEKDIDADGEQSIKDFAHSLAESSFKAESLSLIDRKEIPKDAAVIAIVGPSMPYLDSELQWLREYLSNGGKIFLAIDPGQRHNLANLTKSLGVQFENNFVITTTPVVGGGPAMILGRSFDGKSDITKNFPATTTFAMFYLVSEVKAASDKAVGIQVSELVRTDNSSFTVNDLRERVQQVPKTRAVSLGVFARGLSEEKKDAKPFAAVVFGDSDFISNRSLVAGVNRDLGLNAFAQLAEQKDLLSIRPKMPKGTMIVLSNLSRLLIVIFAMALPVILLTTSGVVWFRRRGA